VHDFQLSTAIANISIAHGTENLITPNVFWPFWAAIPTVWQLAAQNGQKSFGAIKFSITYH